MNRYVENLCVSKSSPIARNKTSFPLIYEIGIYLTCYAKTFIIVPLNVLSYTQICIKRQGQEEDSLLYIIHGFQYQRANYPKSLLRLNNQDTCLPRIDCVMGIVVVGFACAKQQKLGLCTVWNHCLGFFEITW